jgi:phage-related protein
MKRTTKPISWIKGARKDFEAFPAPMQLEGLRSLTVAAEGSKADNVKPLKGFDDGVMEIVLKHRGDAFRVVYAVQIGDDIWVVHAFQKKSTQGIKTPKHEIDLVKDRIKRLKEQLQ